MAAPMRHVCHLFKRSLSCQHLRCNEQYKPYQLISLSHVVLTDTFSTRSDGKKSSNFFGIDEDDKSLPNPDFPKTDDKELFKKYSLSKGPVVKETSYGSIRFDNQAPVKPGRQISNRSERREPISDHIQRRNDGDPQNRNRRSRDISDHPFRTRGNKSNEYNYFDEQYFPDHLDTNESGSQNKRAEISNDTRKRKNLYESRSHSNDHDVTYGSHRSSTSMNYVDDQYFHSVNSEQTGSRQPNKHEEDLWFEDHDNTNTTKPDSNYIDDQYFENPDSNSNNFVDQSQKKGFASNKVDSDDIFEQQYFGDSTKGKDNQEHVFNERPVKSWSNRSRKWDDNDGNNDRQRYNHTVHRNYGERPKSRLTTLSRKTEGKPKEPLTAYDVALEVRKKLKDGESDDTKESKEAPRLFSGPVDSKGYRILKNQVPDIMNTPSAMVVDQLKKSIIYNRDDIIAIDKPYGLPSHGGPDVHMSIGQLLPALARLLDPTGQMDSLHLVHRLDRQTTGVMLLAKTAEKAWQLNGAFRRREVVKRYWVLTKGIPRPGVGIIDIPLAEGTVEKYYRMVLKPEMTDDTRLVSKRSYVQTHRALTKYEVVASYGDTALVECTPETGLKHQIRVHLAFGLNTPILGDHKYSHITKMAPQRLHPDTLHLLGIRQSKVRHLPMMLHAKSLLLPEFQDGKNIFISCPLPPHFTVNMKRLKIKLPNK